MCSARELNPVAEPTLSRYKTKFKGHAYLRQRSDNVR